MKIRTLLLAVLLAIVFSFSVGSTLKAQSTMDVRIRSEGAEGGTIAVRIFYPEVFRYRSEMNRNGEGGVVIIVQGENDNDNSNLYASDLIRTIIGEGLIAIKFLFPGSSYLELENPVEIVDKEWNFDFHAQSTDGNSDLRSLNRMKVLRDVIRFSLNLKPDNLGNFIKYLIPETLTTNTGIIALSNGNNIAMSTMEHFGAEMPGLAFYGSLQNPYYKQKHAGNSVIDHSNFSSVPHRNESSHSGYGRFLPRIEELFPELLMMVSLSGDNHLSSAHMKKYYMHLTQLVGCLNRTNLWYRINPDSAYVEYTYLRSGSATPTGVSDLDANHFVRPKLVHNMVEPAKLRTNCLLAAMTLELSDRVFENERADNLSAVLVKGPGLVFKAPQRLPLYTGDLFDAHIHLFEVVDIVSEAEMDVQVVPASVFSTGPATITIPGINAGILLYSSLNNMDDVLSLALADSYVYGGAGFARNDVIPPIDENDGVNIVDENTPDFIERQLNAGMSAIGELNLHHNEFPISPNGDHIRVDSKIMLEIYKLAAAENHDVPVFVHVEWEYRKQLLSALDSRRSTKFVWAHAGDATDIASLVIMMATHPNLFIDISSRNPFWMRNGMSPEEQTLTVSLEDWTIKPEWKAIFEKYPNRFLFGSDASSEDRNTDLPNLKIYYRTVLGQLSGTTAAKIGYQNIQRLLNI